MGSDLNASCQEGWMVKERADQTKVSRTAASALETILPFFKYVVDPRDILPSSYPEDASRDQRRGIGVTGNQITAVWHCGDWRRVLD